MSHEWTDDDLDWTPPAPEPAERDGLPEPAAEVAGVTDEARDEPRRRRAGWEWADGADPCGSVSDSPDEE